MAGKRIVFIPFGHGNFNADGISVKTNKSKPGLIVTNKNPQFTKRGELTLSVQEVAARLDGLEKGSQVYQDAELLWSGAWRV